MKKSRIKFIKEAHEAACSDWKERIEKEFPEIFPKEELRVGDWVWVQKCLVRWNGEYGNYTQTGFKSCGGWGANKIGIHKDSPIRKAAKEEIESHLIAEAKKRGYKPGVTIDKSNIPFYQGESKMVWKIQSEGFDYLLFDDALILGSDYIYQQGQWAEIIEEKMPTIIRDAINELGKDEIKKWVL